MLHTARFLCSVAAAFARLLRDLRKVLSRCRASLPTATSPAPSPAAGVISAMTLALRREKPASVIAAPEQPVVVASPPAAVVGEEVPNVVGNCYSGGETGKKKKKTAWVARRRPTRQVIPVADDAGGEMAAGWAAAAAQAKEADLQEVEGEGFRLSSRAGPRHAMEDAYAVVTH